MISLAERRRRKAKADQLTLVAYYTIDRIDKLLDFNERLRKKASDIKLDLILLHEKLEVKR